MAVEDEAEIVELMLREFPRFVISFGGLEFYGNSAEYRELIELCRDFASGGRERALPSTKIYFFVDAFQGKSTIAKATEFEAKANNVTAALLDGRTGAAQKTLLELRDRRDLLVIVDDLPESAGNRRTILERFNSLLGRGILFSTSDYLADANLDRSIPSVRLKHVDHRVIDKLAWLIGLIRERLQDSVSGEVDVSAVSRLPARMLTTLASATFGPRVGELPKLAERITEALRLQIALESGSPLPADELARIFVEFFSPPEVTHGAPFRLWVEGESDWRICKLLARLAREHKIVDIEDGLEVLPLGLGREGGTSKIADVVLSRNPRKNKDIFLLDCDEPGRHGAKELQELGQDAVLLDPKLACSRCDSDVEIEDFVKVSCLDNFYQTNSDLRPEREIIRYKSPTSRRLVVAGSDKETFLLWLESNASLSDLENLFVILCDIRARFSLRIHLSAKELESWKQNLREENNADKQVGKRPRHWL